MATIFLGDKQTETISELPEIGTQAAPFTLTCTDLTDTSMLDFAGQTIILNIFPSLDTSVCAASVRRFNKEAGSLKDTVVLCISADLPFAHKRFCELEGLDDVVPLSVFRSLNFGKDYGVTITSGPFKGLMSRCIVIIDISGKIIYTEQVPAIGQEPDYESALKSIKKK